MHRFKESNGRVYLVGDKGKVQVSGKIKAPGGVVHVLGKNLWLEGEGTIDVSSAGQAGTILFGGDYQGKNPDIPNADAVYLGPEAKLLAAGINEGHGGKIITWGDRANLFFSTFNADGGKVLGDGGFVEISSKGNLSYNGTGSATATNGTFGEVLFDPTNITIIGAANVGCTPGAVYAITAATATAAITGVGNLNALLNAGTNVTISTTTGFLNLGSLDFNGEPIPKVKTLVHLPC